MTTLKCFIADIIIKTPLSQNQNYKCYQLIKPITCEIIQTAWQMKNLMTSTMYSNRALAQFKKHNITPKHAAIIFDNFGETIYVADNFKYRIMKNI